MKRKALVGTSSPIGYDYRTKATKAQSDISSSPNPILDSPFGLLLLYDEIWFLCRSLCPENMRNLDYVHFVDEEMDIPSHIGQLGWKELDTLKEADEWKNVVIPRKIIAGRDPVREGYQRYGVTWDGGVDNHTHSLMIGSIPAHGNPTEDRLLFDLVLSKALGLSEYELITNTYTHTMLAGKNTESVSAHEYAEFLVIDGIPNYISRLGPHHRVVDEARENQYLKHFRDWVVRSSPSTSVSELKEAKEAVEASIQEIQTKLFLRYLDPMSLYWSLGKSALGNGVDLLIPGASTVTSVIENLVGRKAKDQIRWQGFLVSLRGKT